MDQDFIAIVGVGVAVLTLLWNTRSETVRHFAEMKQGTDARFAEMKQDMNVRSTDMNARFETVDARFDTLERKTDALAAVVYGVAERTARIEGVLLGPGRPVGNGEAGPRWPGAPTAAEPRPRRGDDA